MEENVQNTLMTNMINNLPTLRKKLNISQIDLANMLGVSRTTVLSIENRKRPLTWSMFLSLVLIFSKNEETNKLLTVFDIYTEELNNFIANIGERR